MPILLESSIQAQILIPMATSIAFGEFFATIVVLYLVPVSYSLYWDAGGQVDVAQAQEDHLADSPTPHPVVEPTADAALSPS